MDYVESILTGCLASDFKPLSKAMAAVTTDNILKKNFQINSPSKAIMMTDNPR